MTRFDRVDRQILQGHDDGDKTKKSLLVCDDLFIACCNPRPSISGTGRSSSRRSDASTSCLANYWRLRESGGALGLKEPS